MAIINNLALSMGGGIISLKQQAKQAENTVSILIGLGGTGVDCIREIKTQVYSRIEPDGGEDATVARYRHIRFLGVDADNANCAQDENPEDKKTAETLSLSEDEAFTLAGSGIKFGAGGVRQVGRFLLMSKAADFMTKLKILILDAKIGLESPKVVVHIFSGMGGGTGSGTFLDVCYMVREVIKNEPKAYTCGYFFMPDVNVSHVRTERVKEYIRVNGYAAMQELDYYMNLENNHGKFMQEYTGGTFIEWNRSLVDFCHLISARDNNGNVREDAYNYAMKVTSEYVFEFLVKTAHLNSEKVIIGELEKDKKYGYFINYLSIGASSAVVPLKEINTYLATRLFERFSQVGKDTPNENDVWNLAVGIFGATNGEEDIQSRVYQSIYSLLQGNAKNSFTQWDEGQTAKKEGILAKNRDGLLDAKSPDSLINRVKIIMYTVITDINRGPVFGFNILNGANNFSIDNIIDGLIMANKEKQTRCKSFRSYKENTYTKALKDWLDNKSKIIGRNSRYSEYVRSREDLAYQEYLEKTFEYMDVLLTTFKTQVRNMSSNYYSVLSQIFKNLRETFKDNSSVLANGIIFDEVKGFEKALINIEDPNLQQALIGELRKVTPSTVFKQLIEALIKDEKAWKSDTQIARVVTGYFVGNNGILRDFADKTIENFLEIVYDTDDNDKIADKIKKDWLSMLHSSAAPLVYKDNKVYEGTIATLCRMSVPIGALSLKKAADEYIQVNSDTEIAVTGAKDRLSCLTYAAGFPICSLKGVDEVEREYFTTLRIGAHSYESTGLDTEFSDWRELPLLTPVSLLEDKLDRLPLIMCERVQASIKTCDDVLKYGIYSATDGCRLRLLCVKTELESELHRVSDEALACVNEFETLKEQDESADADVGIDKHKGLLSRKDMLIQKISEIRDGLSNKDYYEDTDYELIIIGELYNDDDFMRIAKDELCYSPVMLLNAQKSITIIEKAYQTIEKMVTMLRYIK